MTITYTNDLGDECEEELPCKREVCPRCEGLGTHLNPAIGQHAYSQEEFDREFDDEEREQYFKRGGIYDVQCQECRGEKVVDVIDEEACRTEEQKRILREYREGEEDRARMDAEDRATYRMESGGYGD
jgi:hypothetical protein